MINGFKKIGCLFCLSLVLGFTHSSLASQQRPKTIRLNPDAVKRFGMAIAEIKNLYVKSISDEKLFNSAIQGILSGLDPHSIYLNEQMYKSLMAKTSGQFVGLGVEITQEKGLVKVISPIDGTPAQKAGVKAGDFILAIDKHPILNQPLTKVVSKLRGKKGSTVSLTLMSKNSKKPHIVMVKRDVIRIVSVKSKLLEKGFGYVRITHFQKSTAKKLARAIAKLRKQSGGSLKGLVLDLRNNPGGLLISGVQVSDAFLDLNQLGVNKKIISTKGRIKQTYRVAYATKGDILYGAPLIVLINQGSASASEIVAGALQDHKRAIIMGQNSFGKGSLQTILPLDKKTGIKLTTALYYTPKGRSIQAKGITPDILVDNLKVQKEKENALFLWSIKEADLNGHLENGNGEIKRIKRAKRLNLLATSDYQLYEALRLLKSLNILKQKDITI